ncbi:polyprenol monophosphomannose synthase [Microbacterium sp. 22303]|uniref:polyprenol monophosphomannose synthase n=1 Tax=Microbacterium sp. 22303 TaxID=3453905 RepID=UPI003F846DB7
MRTLVIVPTYNEAANILHTLDEIGIYLPAANVLVVDDDSPDGTGSLVAARAATDPRVALLSRTAKNGLGSAYRAGFAQALELGYDAIVEMDADGSHPAQRLPALVDALHVSDLAIGSRWVSAGTTKGWSLHRHLLSRMASIYVRWMLGTTVRDATSGFRAFRSQTLATIDAASTTSNGYSFQIETLHRAHECGLIVEEVPISFAEREHGQSKMSLGIIIEALTRVARWRHHPFHPRVQHATPASFSPSKASP